MPMDGLGMTSKLKKWWKAAGDQNGSSSVQWMNANDQTAWEPEGLIGGLVMNSIETKYIEQDELGQNWLRLNYDCGAAVTALPIAIAGDLALEKRGEFRVASGSVIPNLGKINMKSTDERGIERTVRGNITEVSKPLLSAAEASKRWDSILFEDGGILPERRSPVALEVRAFLEKAQGLESSWQEHQALPRGQLVQCTCANWRCHTGACTRRTSRGKLDQDGG